MCGRLARKDILYDGCFGHVISRSIRKLKIFKKKSDFETFKRLLIIEKRRSKFKIYHYCLMQTHFHLAVQIKDVNAFSRSLSRIKSGYASEFHAKYRLSGPIWRERYKSLLIENEDYLFSCGRYIERNPVRAGLVEREEDWEESSYRHYHGQGTDSLVDGYDDLENKKHFKVNEELSVGDYEKGNIIGSSFFKFQFFERRK